MCTNVSNPDMPCVPTSATLICHVYHPNFPKYGFWDWNFENLCPESESAPPRYHLCQFSGKTDNSNFLGSNLPKKGFWGRNFKILSLDSESAPSIHHECQFSVKTDNFEFFGLNLGKLPNHVRYFGSYSVEGVRESWVEAEMSWVEVEMRWVKVDGDGWSWVEVDGAGCTV